MGRQKYTRYRSWTDWLARKSYKGVPRADSREIISESWGLDELIGLGLKYWCNDRGEWRADQNIVGSLGQERWSEYPDIPSNKSYFIQDPILFNEINAAQVDIAPLDIFDAMELSGESFRVHFPRGLQHNGSALSSLLVCTFPDWAKDGTWRSSTMSLTPSCPAAPVADSPLCSSAWYTYDTRHPTNPTGLFGFIFRLLVYIQACPEAVIDGHPDSVNPRKYDPRTKLITIGNPSASRFGTHASPEEHYRSFHFRRYPIQPDGSRRKGVVFVTGCTVNARTDPKTVIDPDRVTVNT